MISELKNSLSSPIYFGKKNENSMKNPALNFGVVAPPDKLPNASLYDSVNVKNNPPVTNKGNKQITAGDVSAGLTFGAVILSAVSLFAFLRGKK